MDCDVCCETRATTLPCARCDFSTCRVCTRRALEEGHPAACLQCRAPMSTDEVVRRVGKTYYATTHRAQVRARIARREQAKLPLVVPWANVERDRRHLRHEIRRLSQEFQHTGDWNVVRDLRELQRRLHSLGAPSMSRVVRCASCADFLSTDEADVALHCGRCGTRTCVRCRARVDATPHVCAPADLQSLEAIARECRPCPNCGASSYRDSGCPVMWCVECHTFWQWDTRLPMPRGQTPHNPDHRQWMQRAGPMREVGDVPCGGTVDLGQLHAALMREFARSLYVTEGAAVVLAASDAVLVAQRLRHGFPRTWDPDTVLRPLRVGYLLGDYASEDAFVAAVSRAERDCEYRRDVGEVFEGFVFASTDVLQRFVHDQSPDCDAVALELAQVRDLFRDAIERVATCHTRVVPRLTDDWKWTVRGRALRR